MMTGLPRGVRAGLFDRGEIVVGKLADVNIVDHEKLKIILPTFEHDLPAGAPRWMQTVEGYKATYKNGVKTFEDGQSTGALPAGLVRNQYPWRSASPSSHPDLNRPDCNTDSSCCAGQANDIDAVFADPVRDEIMAMVAAGLDGDGEVQDTSMDTAMERTVEEGATGPTHMSRMAREMDKEANAKKQTSKL